jgi:Transcriptional regulators
MNIDKLCSIRSIYKAIGEFEQQFFKQFGLGLNESMILCLLKESDLSSGELAEKLGLTCSNASKVIKSIEQKGLIKRMLGEKDKRQMYFGLTSGGKKQIDSIECETIRFPFFVERPEILNKEL